LGAISAIILHSMAYAYQLSTVKGSLMHGINLMVENFLRRTSGNSADFHEAYKASLESKVSYVLGL